MVLKVCSVLLRAAFPGARYGLTASVYSGDLPKARRIAAGIRAGQVGINGDPSCMAARHGLTLVVPPRWFPSLDSRCTVYVDDFPTYPG